LLPYQFCNLTEINASDVEGQEDFNSRAKAASMLGSMQAAYTDFHYLRSIWKENTEKEALIGVGITGIASGRLTKLNLVEAAEVVKAENARVAAIIGINIAARCTVVKPSGTTSCVVGTSSGIHAWHNDYYIRRMRVGKNEPLYAYMKKTVPDLIEDCYFKPNIEAVMSFPQKAPEGAILRTESFLDLLERTKRFNVEWVATGHRDGVNHNNVSVTVSLNPGEWEQCAEWMWAEKDIYTGISLLPADSGRYRQAPFENVTKEQFEELVEYLHDIDLTQVVETDDVVQFTNEVACAGGLCEII
jgi:ribonucleoside-diphosphate reductase alpha chain